MLNNAVPRYHPTVLAKHTIDLLELPYERGFADTLAWSVFGFGGCWLNMDVPPLMLLHAFCLALAVAFTVSASLYGGALWAACAVTWVAWIAMCAIASAVARSLPRRMTWLILDAMNPTHTFSFNTWLRKQMCNCYYRTQESWLRDSHINITAYMSSEDAKRRSIGAVTLASYIPVALETQS